MRRATHRAIFVLCAAAMAAATAACDEGGGGDEPFGNGPYELGEADGGGLVDGGGAAADDSGGDDGDDGDDGDGDGGDAGGDSGDGDGDGVCDEPELPEYLPPPACAAATGPDPFDARHEAYLRRSGPIPFDTTPLDQVHTRDWANPPSDGCGDPPTRLPLAPLPSSPSPLCSAEPPPGFIAGPVSDAEPLKVSSVGAAFEGTYGCRVDLRLSDCLGPNQPDAYEGFRFWRRFTYAYAEFTAADVHLANYAQVISATPSGHDRVRLTIDQPAWALCTQHMSRTYLHEPLADWGGTWEFGFSFDGLGLTPVEDGNRPLTPFGAELTPFAPLAHCPDFIFGGSPINCPWGEYQTVAHAKLAVVDPCRLVPEGPVIDAISVASNDTLRVHLTAPVADLADVDPNQFALSLERQRMPWHAAEPPLPINPKFATCDTDPPVSAGDGISVCDERVPLLPTSVTADPADASALFLHFDGSVQALCDDLDKPSFEQLQAASPHAPDVILDIGVKLHYLPRPDDPGRWLRATGGTPVAVLDPQLVNATQPVHYYRHFRVSGANPYVECFAAP